MGVRGRRGKGGRQGYQARGPVPVRCAMCVCARARVYVREVVAVTAAEVADDHASPGPGAAGGILTVGVTRILLIW